MDAKEYIQELNLAPHPEGGWYRQVYGNDENGMKRISTIYYMLCDKDFSAFHRLHDVVEIWYYHAGEPRPGSRNMNFGLIDAGIVSENISLYCTALGLGTVCCAPRMQMEEIARAMGLSEQEIPVLYHPIGHPAE